MLNAAPAFFSWANANTAQSSPSLRFRTLSATNVIAQQTTNPLQLLLLEQGKASVMTTEKLLF